MSQFITRFFLALSILFSSGYSHAHAHFYDSGVNSTTETAKSPTKQAHQLSTSSSLHEKDTSKLTVFEIEEKEDVLISFKQFVANSIHYFAVLCTLLLALLYSKTNISLLYSRLTNYISTLRIHLVIQVFRIQSHFSEALNCL